MMGLPQQRTWEDILGEPANELDGDFEERAAIVARLNRTHAFIAGKGVIREDGRGGFAIESVRQFHDWYANDGIWTKTANGADKFTAASQVWMQSRDRRQFDAIVLDPRGDAEGAYNLWRDFSYRPGRKGSCDLFLAHVRDNVCKGDKRLFRWLVGWMAHLIQRPWEKPGTAVVLKGKMGVGKSTVGEHLGALISRHYATVYTPRQLTGNFNAHLASALLVQIEEGFWAGDKSAEGDLKHKITGPTFNLERKGQDVIELPSFHRYLISSNERWTVPARHDERRYAIFDVGDANAKDGAYFAAIKAELDAGGYRALMRHLLDFDLSQVDVREIPKTEALAVEKLTGLKGVHAWWHEVLKDGAYWNDSGVARVRTDALRRDFDEWMHGRRHHGDLLTADGFGRDLREMCPSMERTNQLRVHGERVRYYELPSRRQCRLEFARWFDSEVDWA